MLFICLIYLKIRRILKIGKNYQNQNSRIVECKKLFHLISGVRKSVYLCFIYPQRTIPIFMYGVSYYKNVFSNKWVSIVLSTFVSYIIFIQKHYITVHFYLELPYGIWFDLHETLFTFLIYIRNPFHVILRGRNSQHQ